MADIETWRESPQAGAVPPARPDSPRPQADTTDLRTLPPLVFAGECDLLRSRLARVARGEAFVLQGGLHANTYGRQTADGIRDALRTMLQMSALLTYATTVPVVKVSRIAHAAGPPRPLPRYQTSAAALNLVRALASGGYGGLRQVHAWNREFVATSPSRAVYEPLTARLGRALDFMTACGSPVEDPADVEFFASHEAGELAYESALTRIDSRAGEPYNTAGHLVSLDVRDGGPGSRFLDYLAAVRNPIALVLGPGTGPEEAVAPLERLDPSREAGRITFVVRMGADAVRDTLPTVIQKVMAQGHQAAWICDALHPGTPRTRGGRPAGPRTFDDVLDEVTAFFRVHRELATHPGGLHVELTGRESGPRAGRGLQRHPPAGAAAPAPAQAPRLTRDGALDLAFQVAGAYRAPVRARR